MTTPGGQNESRKRGLQIHLLITQGGSVRDEVLWWGNAEVRGAIQNCTPRDPPGQQAIVTIKHTVSVTSIGGGALVFNNSNGEA